MSRYTVEYGTVYDSGFQALIDGLASYPIYDESHRAELNQKIYNRYRFREIAFETAAMFTHYFITLLNEIMPYYNELYRSAALDYEILQDADYYEDEGVQSQTASTGSASTTSHGQSTAGTTSHDATAHSDTPQGSFDFSAVTNNEYLSDATVSDSTGSSTGTTSDSSTSNTSMNGSGASQRQRHVHGKFPGKTYQELVKDFRDLILNIDKMILDELNVCFMGVY